MGDVLSMGGHANDDADAVTDYLDRVAASFANQSGMPPDVLTRAMMAKACNGLIADLGADETARLLMALAVRISPPKEVANA